MESRSESDHDTGGGGQIGNLDQLAYLDKVEKMRSQFISLKTPWFTTAKPGQALVFRGCCIRVDHLTNDTITGADSLF